MSLLGKPIEDVITVLYKSIQAKRDVIENVKRECKLNERGEKDVVEISKLKLIDLLEEFEITISQSLQCIQTLQAEICNLKENVGDTSTSSTIKEFVGCSCIEAISPQGKDVNNISVITSLTSNNNNGHNQSQVYHKPKLVMQGGKGSGSSNGSSSNKLNFDYSAFMMNNNVINNVNNNIQQAHCVLNENILPPDITTTTANNNNNVSISVSNYNCNNKQQQQVQQQQQHQPFTISYTNDSDDNSDEEEPKIERTKVPIRQQLMISTNRSYQFNNSNTNIHNNSNTNIEQHVPSITSRRDVLMSKVNQIEKETKTKQLITQINTNMSYKTYITNKYGNGSYDNFITKLTSNQIDINTLENELRIISQLIATDKTLQKKKHTTNTNTSSSSNSRYNTITKSRGNTPRKLSKDHTNTTNPSDTIYIEPVKFENTLRSGNSNNTTIHINDHHRNNSKSKRKSTSSIDKTIKHI